MASARGPGAFRSRGVRLTRRGWWFVASSGTAFFVAYVGGREVFLFVGSLMLVLPILSVAMVWLQRPRVEATRSFSPALIPAGSATSVSITVRNRSPRRSLPANWSDELPWYPYTTQVSRLPVLEGRGERFGGHPVTVRYDLVPPRRGVFAIGPLTVAITDGFGLARTSLVVGEPQPLIVTPEVVPLANAGLTVPAGDGEATLVQRRAAGDEDDLMTREYRSGDAMRRVHWRASARHGDLMVRQEEQRSFPEARIIVDTQRDGYRDAMAMPSDFDVESVAFEWVVQMLASSAVHLRRNGFRVSIVEAGVAQLDGVGADRRRTWGDDEFLAQLATLELADTERMRPVRSGSGPLVALLGSPTHDTVDWMLTHRRPGELAVAFLVHGLSPIDRIDRSFGVPREASTITERFVEAGWLVVPVRPDDDPAAAWEAVVAETGRARGWG